MSELLMAMPWLLAISAGHDGISGQTGDNNRNVAIGKDIGQDNRDYSSPVHIYNTPQGVPNRPQPHDDDETRLRRLEFYMYGDGYGSPGLIREVQQISQQLATIQRWLYIIAGALLALLAVTLLYAFVLRIPIA